MKRQIVFGFATIMMLVGVFSASSIPAKKSVQPVNGIMLPAPTCHPCM